MRIGIYPGTFDPITFGHVDIIKRAYKLVDRLIIGVAQDVVKNPVFSSDLRAEMVRYEINELDIPVEIMIFSGLLAYFAQTNNASIIIRGLRAVSDFDYEFQMSWINYKLTPEVETIFLPASEDAQFISSSFVKEIAKLKGDISMFVSSNVCSHLSSFYKV